MFAIMHCCPVPGYSDVPVGRNLRINGVIMTGCVSCPEQ